MIIGLSGKARSGKDTFAEFLGEALFDVKGRSYIKMAYATELKNRVQKDFDFTWDQLWGNRKEFADPRYFNKSTERYWTPREVLQSYGEFFRSVDSNFWVKHLFNTIIDNEYKNVIVTDLRMKNEVDAVVKDGGFHIRIMRENVPKINNSNHISDMSSQKADSIH